MTKQIHAVEDIKKKMRELDIFRTMQPLGNNTYLHVDDMPVYTSWFLIEHHNVDEIVYRGASAKMTDEQLMKAGLSAESLKEVLSKLGNPMNILITKSEQDTY